MEHLQKSELKKKLRDARAKKHTMTYEEFDQLFRIYDLDNNGRLQYCEINNFMKDLLMRIDRTRRSVKKGLTDKEMMEYSQKVAKLISKYDTDRSGTLDKREVARMLNVKIPVDTGYSLDTPVKVKTKLFGGTAVPVAEDPEVCYDVANPFEEGTSGTSGTPVIAGNEIAVSIEDRGYPVSLPDYESSEVNKTEDIHKKESSTEAANKNDCETAPTAESQEDPEEQSREDTEGTRGQGQEKPKEEHQEDSRKENEDEKSEKNETTAVEVKPELNHLDKSGWHLMQKRTYIEWVENKLYEWESTYEVTNLAENLGDGILLPLLTSKLLDKELSLIKPNPKLMFHRYENIRICIEELRDNGCMFTSVDVAGDITSGNEKLCLSFMKTLIGHFTVKPQPGLLSIVAKAQEQKTMSKQEPVFQPAKKNNCFFGVGNQHKVKMKPMSIVIPQFKQTMTYGVSDIMAQASNILKDHGITISNLASDWMDGEALLLVCNRFCRGIYKAYQHEHPIVKIGMAMLCLNRTLDIETEVTYMEIYNSQSSISNFKYYLSQILFEEDKDLPPFSRTPEFASKEKELRNVSMISASLARKSKLMKCNTDDKKGSDLPEPADPPKIIQQKQQQSQSQVAKETSYEIIRNHTMEDSEVLSSIPARLGSRKPTVVTVHPHVKSLDMGEETLLSGSPRLRRRTTKTSEMEKFKDTLAKQLLVAPKPSPQVPQQEVEQRQQDHAIPSQLVVPVPRRQSLPKGLRDEISSTSLRSLRKIPIRSSFAGPASLNNEDIEPSEINLKTSQGAGEVIRSIPTPEVAIHDCGGDDPSAKVQDVIKSQPPDAPPYLGEIPIVFEQTLGDSESFEVEGPQYSVPLKKPPRPQGYKIPDVVEPVGAREHADDYIPVLHSVNDSQNSSPEESEEPSDVPASGEPPGENDKEIRNLLNYFSKRVLEMPVEATDESGAVSKDYDEDDDTIEETQNSEDYYDDQSLANHQNSSEEDETQYLYQTTNNYNQQVNQMIANFIVTETQSSNSEERCHGNHGRESKQVKRVRFCEVNNTFYNDNDPATDVLIDINEEHSTGGANGTVPSDGITRQNIEEFLGPDKDVVTFLEP